MTRILLFLFASLFAASAQAENLGRDRTKDKGLLQRPQLDPGVMRFPSRIGRTPKAVLNAKLANRRGDEILFRTLIDRDSGYILGTPVPGLQIGIIGISREGDDTHLIIDGRKDGKYYGIRREDISVYNQRGKEQCTEVRPIKKSVTPIKVVMAIDISGSMVDALSDVRASAQAFVTKLPSQAQCQIVLFDHGHGFLASPDHSATNKYQNESPGFAQCSKYAQSNYLEKMIVSRDGGTNLVNPLTDSYNILHSQTDVLNLNLLMIISDGLGPNGINSRPFKRLIELRNSAIEHVGTYTFVNWLGAYKNTNMPLSVLADDFLVGRVGSNPVAEDFFNRTSNQINNTHVVTVRSCE